MTAVRRLSFVAALLFTAVAPAVAADPPPAAAEPSFNGKVVAVTVKGSEGQPRVVLERVRLVRLGDRSFLVGSLSPDADAARRWLPVEDVARIDDLPATDKNRALLSRAAETRVTVIDLQPWANEKLTDNFGSGREGNNLTALPRGEQTLNGVKFHVGDGLLQLDGPLLNDHKAEKIEGIKVGGPVRRLHVLHATGYGNGQVIGQEGQPGDPLFVPDGAKVAEYRVRYEDGTVESVPLIYGQDIRDWWFTENVKGVTRGRVAWVGDNPLAKELGSRVRLYQLAWDNPHPAKRVAAIDYVRTGDTPAAPFCVAITAEQ
jgi:hypothetical protein